MGHVYSDTLSYVERVYANERECTITNDNVQHIATRCSTKYKDARQYTTMYNKNDLLTTVVMSHPNVLHGKLFLKYAALPTKS